MRFKSVTDLYDYLIESESKNGLIDYIDVDVKHSKPVKECQCEHSDHSVIKIASLFDSPSIEHKESMNEHEIHVNAYDAIKDACGTGKIELLGRTVLLNICESEDSVHVNLDIEVDGHAYNNVPFTVKLTEGTDCYIMLNKTLL